MAQKYNNYQRSNMVKCAQVGRGDWHEDPGFLSCPNTTSVSGVCSVWWVVGLFAFFYDYVTQANLEFTTYTRLASNSQRSTCLCLLQALELKAYTTILTTLVTNLTFQISSLWIIWELKLLTTSVGFLFCTTLRLRIIFIFLANRQQRPVSCIAYNIYSVVLYKDWTPHL